MNEPSSTLSGIVLLCGVRRMLLPSTALLKTSSVLDW